MRVHHGLYLLWVLIHSVCSSYSATFRDAQNLETYLLSNYSQSLRPILNQSEAIVVNLTFDLEGVIEIDDVGQTLTTNAVFRVTWRDEFLRWKPEVFGGIEYVNIPTEKRWLPRLMIVNCICERDLFSGQSHPYTVYANGVVEWTPASVFKTFCALDMTNFPFDKQVCEITILPIDFKRKQLKLLVEDISFDAVQENGEWVVERVLGSSGMDNKLNMSQISVQLILTRRPAFILLNVFLPVIVMSFLNVAVFAVPVDSGEKLSYVLTVLLSLAVFMSTLSSMLPTTSIYIPYITIYLSSLIVISTLSVLMTVLIINIHGRGRGQAIPCYLHGLTRLMMSGTCKKVKAGEGEGGDCDKVTWKCVASALDKISLYLTSSLAIVMCLTLVKIIYV